jgi:hypothetical protein
LGQPFLEFEPPLFQGSVEKIVYHVEPAFFVRPKLIDIAVFKGAGSES